MVIKKQTPLLDDNKAMISFIKNSINKPIKKSWFVRSFLFKKKLKEFFSEKRTENDRIEESVFVLQLIVNYASLFKNSFEKQENFLKKELRVLSCDCSRFCQTRSMSDFITKTIDEFFNSFGFNKGTTVTLLKECCDNKPMNELYNRTHGPFVDQLLLVDHKLQELREEFFGAKQGVLLLEDKLITQALINYYDLRLTQDGKEKTRDLTVDEQELSELLSRITIKPIKNGEYLVLNAEPLINYWLEKRGPLVCCERVLTVYLKELLLVAKKRNKSTELFFLLLRGYFSRVFVLQKHSSYWNPLLVWVKCLLDTDTLNNSELKELKKVIIVHKKNTFGLHEHNKALRLLYKNHPLLRFL